MIFSIHEDALLSLTRIFDCSILSQFKIYFDKTADITIYSCLENRYKIIPVNETIHNYKRADNNLDLFIVRRTNLPPWLLGHQWSGNSLGARLKQARVTNNMTIRDLCAVTGLSDVAIKNLESDKFNASLPNLRKFAKVLKVSIEYLGCFGMLPENTLAQRITKARLFYGFTKEEFAQIIGVDVKTLRNWEQGKHVPLSRYSDVLNQYMEAFKK